MEKDKKLGRPTLYKGKETDTQVYRLCLLGATDIEMCEIIGVSETAFNNWKHIHPTFVESLKRGKGIADGNVASKLYSRAIGYEYDEISTEQDVEKKTVKQRTTTKHVPSDTTASIFWLKNRRPDLWRDRRELTGADGSELVKPDIDLSKLSDEQKRLLLTIGEDLLEED